MDGAEGARIRRQVLGPDYVDKTKAPTDIFSRALIDFVEEHVWGNVWVRPGLDLRTRSMLNVAMLAVLGRPHELAVHLRGAIRNGVTEEEIVEILLQAGVYGGAPAAVEGLRIAREALGHGELGNKPPD